jgi:hypothetical protein
VIILLTAGLGALWLYSYSGWYGFNIILRRGMTTWTTVTPEDPRLSPSMRLALLTPPPPAKAGAFTWQSLQDGLDVGELPVLADGTEVDRILLARLSPEKFRFEVLNEPAGNIDLDDWMQRTGASLVINGSYYSRYGLPDTPILSNGRSLGPTEYDARHGAFVSDGHQAAIRDLKGESWGSAFAGATNAFVNYPLLIGADGNSRALKSDRRWLANRSFVAQDGSGRIVVGTTMEAFFSLDRLAEFLASAPLGLRLVLNLDGGPPACQAVAASSFKRSFCGKWETQTRGDEIRLLGHLVGQRRWALPMVLVARAR